MVPVNLRSFSAEWDQKPQYRFSELRTDLRYADQQWVLGLRGPLRMLGLWAADEPTQQEYLAAPVRKGAEVVGTVQDFENPTFEQPSPDRTRDKFVFHYLAEVSHDHRKLQSLRRIAMKARAAGSRVIFYLTPVDEQTGESLLPGEFRPLVKSNVRLLERELHHGRDGPRSV
ncbi:MAG: hypothetical protein R3B90_11730 [Planctomycetaceae bacterium]